MFKNLIIEKEWRQFGNIDIDFHDRLTILTGANGAGKTTLLDILAEHFGWETKMVSEYVEDEGKGIFKYFSGIFNNINAKLAEVIHPSEENVRESIGFINYKNGATSKITLPTNTDATYKVDFDTPQNISGLYIHSHRQSFKYVAVTSIPTRVATKKEIFNKYMEFEKAFINDVYRDFAKLSATALVKETLISLAAFGEGNSVIPYNKEIKDIFDGYVKILEKVLPQKLGFKKLAIKTPEVLLCTDSGDFPIDAVSGGVASIISITWQIYMFGGINENFVALIDEPENHLHPELQKNFMSNLIEAFPKVQFIVVTHNPMIISAVEDSNIYILDYKKSENGKSKVYSQKLDMINKSGTSNVILRDVLGIETTMPIWAEIKLKSIIEKYSKLDFTTDNIRELKNEMNEIGLGDSIPSTIAEVAKNNG